jgi:hypothetical protein
MTNTKAGHAGQHRDRSGSKWAEVAAQPLGTVAELNARRTAAAAVLADYNAELASAPLASPPGREWMLRLASVLDDLLEALGPDDDEDQGDEDDRAGEYDDEDDWQPYCRTCDAAVGIFIAHGDAWLHYTGQGTPQDPVELFDPGHEAAVAWRPAGAP